MSTDRIHARGPKGEAVVILRTTLADGTESVQLASGEKLQAGPVPGTFITLDGRRTYRVEPVGRLAENGLKVPTGPSWRSGPQPDASD